MTTQELQSNPAYKLLLMLPHENLLPFLQEQLWGKTWTARSYIIINVCLLVGLILFAVTDVQNGRSSWDEIFKNIGLGIFLTLTLLIPLHEGIHGLAYKMAGAPKVSYGVNWRKFYFYAVADDFAISRKVFAGIAVAPFLVISALAGAGIFLFPEWKWLSAGVLFLHTGACAGDFALLGFYERHKNFREMWTFDDVERKISYFYIKEL